MLNLLAVFNVIGVVGVAPEKILVMYMMAKTTTNRAMVTGRKRTMFTGQKRAMVTRRVLEGTVVNQVDHTGAVEVVVRDVRRGGIAAINQQLKLL